MIADLSIVRQDAADLHRFIEPLIRMCADLRDDYPVFTEPSRRFFAYVSQLGLETQAHLETFPDYHAKSLHEAAESSKQQELISLRKAWEDLHFYLRPAIDADSLHLPGPLVDSLQDWVHSVDNWKDYEFVLFHTNQANYFQVPSGMARDVANQIAGIVGGTEFPANLGLIGIPYSQSNGLFLNCVLPHECAHFIFEEHASDDVQEKIEEFLDALATSLGGLADEDMSLCLATLNGWVQETFCDLIAICLIGPAFSFALSQLEAASVVVGRPDGYPDDFYLFTDGYPANAARFFFHQKLLVRLDWWEQVKTWNCAPVRVLEKNIGWSNMCCVEGGISGTVEDGLLLQCYKDVCDWMLDYVVKTMPQAGSNVERFSLQVDTICEYLKKAIVPSTIVINRQQVLPNPVVLINSGYKFYLESIGELLSDIEGQDAKSVASHSYIASRLELWILKALEDSRLLLNQDNA